MFTIVTVTFSPCIDKSTSVPSLVPDKKLKCAVPKLEPGGGGINVARAIKKLGGQATAIYPSGGYTGKFFNHLLEEEKIPTVIVDSRSETRENFIVVDESGNKQYRFGMPGTELFEDEWERCLEEVERLDADFVIASGSLPPGVPNDIYARLARIARGSKARFIVDTSGEALKHAADEGVYLLKPNLGELSTLAGLENISIEQVEKVARDLIDKSCAEVIVVSMGMDGAMLVSQKETYRASPPEVERKSTVGAGDSMVAGIVYSLALGRDLKQALLYGVACGTAATMNAGTELCKKEDADDLFIRLNINSAKDLT